MLLALLLLSTASFPADGLDQRIEFWKSVFTKYGENQLIFHDRKHVHLIYDVLDLKANGVNRDDRKGQRQLETLYRERIGDALASVAQRSPDQWSEYSRSLAKRIAQSGVKENPNVLAERVHVQRGIREKFSESLKRYSAVGRTVEQILREGGIPEDFAALPLIESGYMNTALSHAGAAGIWQFMPSTARQYMKVTASLDQRLDLPIATRSAARLLLNNHAALGSWPLAITAYNHGLAGMKRAKGQCGEILRVIIECYNAPSFGYASANFYAEFLAARELLNEHRGRMPATAVAQAAATHQPADPHRYRVRKGDTLLRLSKKFGTTPEQIMVLNGMDNAHRLIAGRTLLVPKG